MIRQDYAPKAQPAPWYTPLIYMVSMAMMAYALIWLWDIYVDVAQCFSIETGMGCVVVWRGEP